MLRGSTRTLALFFAAAAISGLLAGPRASHSAPLPAPTICQEIFSPSPEAMSVRLPICLSHPLDRSSSSVEQVVIAIHGLGRTAVEESRVVAVTARTLAGGGDRYAVIAPQFLTEGDLAARGLSEDFLYWNLWRWGDLSLSVASRPRPTRVSSFSVVDRLVEKVVDRALFPNLRRLVIFGHSAGGQFVNRYAAGSRQVHTLASTSALDVRYVVANASSYLYFTNERRADAAVGAFAPPPPDVASSCPGFDDYGYGLRNLNRYMSETGPDVIRRQYGERQVVHLLGAQDSDPAADFLDTSCAANLQGRHRLERGLTYYRYLLHAYGQALTEKQKVAVVSGVAHSTRGIVESACGRRFLFDDPRAECREAF